MVNETNVRCFLVLAETLNFTETANRVYLTQQAVSKNISNLESTLGFVLFDRSGRNVFLTNEGAKCLAVFREMDQMYAQMLQEVRSGFAEFSTTLQVGYQSYLRLVSTLLTATTAMQRDFPNAQLTEVRHPPSELLSLLYRDKLDLIVINDRYLPEQHEYNTLELARLPMIVLVSAGDPRITPESTWRDFRNDPYLIERFETESTQDFEQRLENELHTYDLNPSKIIVLPNRDSVYTAVTVGKGIAIGSEFSMLVKDERLASFPTGETDGLSCVWKKEVKKSILLQYVEHVKQAYALCR